eukprot:UN13842
MLVAKKRCNFLITHSEKHSARCPPQKGWIHNRQSVKDFKNLPRFTFIFDDPKICNDNREGINHLENNVCTKSAKVGHEKNHNSNDRKKQCTIENHSKQHNKTKLTNQP